MQTDIFQFLDEKLNVQVKGDTDDGKLRITITNQDNKVYYQLDGQRAERFTNFAILKKVYILFKSLLMIIQRTL